MRRGPAEGDVMRRHDLLLSSRALPVGRESVHHCTARYVAPSRNDKSWNEHD